MKTLSMKPVQNQSFEVAKKKDPTKCIMPTRENNKETDEN